MAGLLDELQRGWGNESFAGERTLLETVAKHAVAASGSILECGPGVSTILLGLLSEKRRVLVFSLENNEEWYRFVSLKFRQLGLRNVRIIYAPLIKYSTFEWYDVSGKLPSDAFDLVVCDGPPEHSTTGGRYGLVPVMSEHFDSHTIIIVDNATTEPGTRMRSRWKTEGGWDGPVHCPRDVGVAVLQRTPPN